MITLWEFWACVNHYVQEHGEGAPVLSAMRSDELLLRGDLEDAMIFRSIVGRINELLEKPTGAVH